MSISDERTDIYAESGISIDKKGLNIRGGVGGTNNISNLLPEKMNLESFSNLSWSLAGEINVLNWDQIVELALCVVAVSALVVVGVVLVADDVSLVGVLNDGLLLRRAGEAYPRAGRGGASDVLRLRRGGACDGGGGCPGEQSLLRVR